MCACSVSRKLCDGVQASNVFAAECLDPFVGHVNLWMSETHRRWRAEPRWCAHTLCSTSCSHLITVAIYAKKKRKTKRDADYDVPLFLKRQSVEKQEERVSDVSILGLI